MEDTQINQETVEIPVETPQNQEEPKEEPKEEKKEFIDPDKEFEKRKKTAQQRINDLTKQKYEAQRRADAAEARLKQYEGEGKGRPIPPNLELFINSDGTIDHTRYSAALSLYNDAHYDWRESQKESKNRENQVKFEEESKMNTFVSQLEILQEKFPDIEQVIEKPVFSPQLRDVLYESEKGAEVAYYLGKNETEAFRISRLPEKQILKEVGRLEEKISGLIKNTSKAPTPPNPVGSGGSIPKDPSKMTDQEWFNWRQQNRIKRE